MPQAGHQAVWQDGAAYERFMGRWSLRTGQQFLEWLGLPSGLRWLDVGCGTGPFSEVILANGKPAEVVAIDPSEKHVAYAREQVIDDRIRFDVGDATALDFPNNVFDVATAALVLNFIPEREKAVHEMARVVRSDGTAAAYVWDFAGRRNVTQHLWDAIAATDPDAGQVRQNTLQASSSNPDTLAEIFRQAGLSNVETHALDIEAEFENFDDYWVSNTSFTSPAGLYCRALSDRQRDRLQAKLKDILPTDRAGGIRFAARAWAVRGRV